MNESKKNKGVIVVISILVVIVLTLGGYILYDKVLKKDEVREENPMEEKEEIEEEEELFDNAIKEEISQKISILESIQKIDTEQNEIAPIYKKDIKSSDMSNDIKLDSVLDNLYYQKNGKSPVTTDYDLSMYGGEEFVQLDLLEVENVYYNLYGDKKIEHKNIESCPQYIYDSKNQKYYGAAACGGTTNLSIESYIYKYTTKSDKLYAYVSLAIVEADDQGTIVYTDYERQNKYSNPINNLENIITIDNYKEFSQYQYTFTKNDDGTYYFDSIEKIV